MKAIREKRKRLFVKKLFESVRELEEHGRISHWSIPWGLDGVVRIEETPEGVVISYKEFDEDEDRIFILIDRFKWIIGQDGEIRREEEIEFGGGKQYAEDIEEILREYQPVVQYISFLKKLYQQPEITRDGTINETFCSHGPTL